MGETGYITLGIAMKHLITAYLLNFPLNFKTRLSQPG